MEFNFWKCKLQILFQDFKIQRYIVLSRLQPYVLIEMYSSSDQMNNFQLFRALRTGMFHFPLIRMKTGGLIPTRLQVHIAVMCGISGVAEVT